MKPITFEQIFSIFDETIQIPQRLIVYSGKGISELKDFIITDSRILVLVTKGNIQLSINYKEYTISANSLFDITANKSVQFISSSDDTAFYCIFTDFEFFREALKNIRPVPHSYLHKIQTQPETSLSAENTQILESAIQ